MNSRLFGSIVVVFAFSVVPTAPIEAHHTFAAEYDSKKPLNLEGTVTKIEWMNPHVRFYIDVTDDRTGETVNWVFEMSAPAEIERNGWAKDTMKVADVVIVTGSRAKSGCPCGGVRTVTLKASGKRLGPLWG